MTKQSEFVPTCVFGKDIHQNQIRKNAKQKTVGLATKGFPGISNFNLI